MAERNQLNLYSRNVDVTEFFGEFMVVMGDISPSALKYPPTQKVEILCLEMQIYLSRNLIMTPTPYLAGAAKIPTPGEKCLNAALLNYFVNTKLPPNHFPFVLPHSFSKPYFQ